MKPIVLIVAVTLFILMDVAVVTLVVGLILARVWTLLMNEFPAVEPTEPNVRKNFQSFSFGAISFGFCVHVIVDDLYLHLRPAAILRVFGCKAVSIPWNQIEVSSESKPSKFYVEATIAGQKLKGPKWCLEMVEQMKS